MPISMKMLAGGIAGIALLLCAGAAMADPGEATAAVNIRSGPGTGYPVVGSLQAGEQVDIQRCQGSWCYVAANGPDGWAASRYLSGSSSVASAGPVYQEPSTDYYDNGYYDNGYYDNGYYGSNFYGGYYSAPIFIQPPYYNNRPYYNRRYYNHRYDRPPYYRRGQRPPYNRPPFDHRPDMGGQNPPTQTGGVQNPPAVVNPQVNGQQANIPPRFRQRGNNAPVFIQGGDNNGPHFNRPPRAGAGQGNFCQINPAACQARQRGYNNQRSMLQTGNNRFQGGNSGFQAGNNGPRFNRQPHAGGGGNVCQINPAICQGRQGGGGGGRHRNQ